MASADNTALQTPRGFTLIEIATAVFIIAIIAAIIVPIISTLLDTNRAGETFVEMQRMYNAVVGDKDKGTYGYIGDTGKFPTSLIDLVQAPASTPGWNGPYLSDARVESGVLYDPYGAPYECYYYADNTQAVADQFAIMSRGPNRQSTNTASSNSCTLYAGSTMPANYGTSSSDADNVVYPRFTDNASLLKYNHLGTLAINIMNYDQHTAVSSLLGGCPHLYTITITSVARGANDTFSMPYAPGANSVDLPEGLYIVAITSPTATSALYQEQVAITPGVTLSRNLNIFTGLNSANTTVVNFAPSNAFGTTLTFFQFTVSLGTVASGSTGSFNVNACSQIFIRNNGSTVVDSLIHPYAAYARRITSSSLCTLTILNRNTLNNAAKMQLLIYDTGYLIGVVSSRGALKQKNFYNVHQGNTIRAADTTGGTALNTTMGCPSTFPVT